MIRKTFLIKTLEFTSLVQQYVVRTFKLYVTTKTNTKLAERIHSHAKTRKFTPQVVLTTSTKLLEDHIKLPTLSKSVNFRIVVGVQ